jgi:hypothetical protein
VREIEAWLLVDAGPFRDFLGKTFEPELPSEPEKVLAPKETWRGILGSPRASRDLPYELFGERVKIPALRALPAFVKFESEMKDALRDVARAQGHPV